MSSTSVGTTDENTTEPPQMERGIKNRHLQLIAIGGSIGTGLFMGSGSLINTAGPGIVLVYLVIGLFVFLIMRMLGELLLSNLHYKTFGDIAKDQVGPWAGFFVSWNYWFSWIVACIADIIAITGYVNFFNEDIPTWLPALIAAVVLTLLNLLPVKFFGEAEFWFAIIKIVAILGLIVVGIVLVVTGFTSPSGVEAKVSNLWEYGGFLPMGISGLLLGFQMGIFSFIGVELVGTAAAETENPRKTLPKAINSIVVRILIFYVGALLVIMMVTPWQDVDPAKSPFVSTLSLAGFGLAAVIINLVVLTSAASSANSGIYSDTRMLFALSHDGHAPKPLGKLGRLGTPRNAVLFTCVFLFLSIPILLAGDSVVEGFKFVSSICATLVLFTWGMICVSYICYLRKDPNAHKASAFKTPIAPVAPWLVLAFFVFIGVMLIIADDTRVPFLCAPIWFVLLTVLWQVRKRSLLREGKPVTGVIPTVQHPLDAEEEAESDS